jgi:hypothetical protein
MNPRMPSVPSTPPRYRQQTVYGPFHRRTKADDKPTDLLRQLLSSGELWGRGPKSSPIPAAMAFAGPLPAGVSGLEFHSLVEPDRPYGPVMYWRGPPHGRARSEDPWAKIDVLIRSASEDSL